MFQILKEINEQNIKLYNFPDTDDEEEKRQFGPLKERVPFAVAGSNNVWFLKDLFICRLGYSVILDIFR